MNKCPGCGYIVPGAWTECRKCGTPVAAVPVTVPVAPVAAGNGFASRATSPPPPPSRSIPMTAAPPVADTSFGAPDDALLPGAKSHGAVPDTMLPTIDPLIVRVQPKSSLASLLTPRNIAIAGLALLVTVAGIYSMIPGAKKAKPAPVVLAPRAPSAGIPTSLSDVVRIAAESARHTALSAVIDAAGATGAALTLPQLATAQPSYQWVLGGEPSTTNTVISITSGPGIDVIAVAATNHDICAFGRWTSNIGTEYVTMAHVTDCAATNAPTAGWSTQPGGSAQDLPGADGN